MKNARSFRGYVYLHADRAKPTVTSERKEVDLLE
jgi:hypothetical protein